MDLPPEADNYIRESIEQSLGLPVSPQTLVLKLQASEESRRRLLDHVFLHQERLKDAENRLGLSRAETSMSAQALRRCIEDKAALGMRYADLERHCASFEGEWSLYEKDRERIMEVCDEFEKENHALKMQVKVLHEHSKVLDRENQNLIRSLKKERRHQESDWNHSIGPANGKRKLCLNDSTSKERTISDNGEESSR